MAISSISDGQSDRKPVSSELHKIILAKDQKGYNLLLKKIKSAFPVNMHIFIYIFNFGQISKFKKGLSPRKKIESKFPVDMRIYTLCPS